MPQKIETSESLLRLYETEPDCGYWPSITDREAELWGPLLIHARLAGPESEAKLLEVVDKFSEEKAEIKSTDSKIAQTIALLEALSKQADTNFTPGDLVPILAQSEAWGRTLAEVKGRDDDSVRVSRAAKVGYFLRNFRLRGKKNSAGHMAYDTESAIACLSAHVPQNLPKSPEPPSQEARVIQLDVDRESPEDTEDTEDTEGFEIPTRGVVNANHESSGQQRVDSLHSGSKSPVAVFPPEGHDSTTNDAMVEGEI